MRSMSWSIAGVPPSSDCAAGMHYGRFTKPVPRTSWKTASSRQSTGCQNVFRPGQPEAEVNDAAAHPGFIRARFEGDDIVRPWSKHLNRVGIAEIFSNTKYRAIEAQRPV